jgi:hypothetical protein
MFEYFDGSRRLMLIGFVGLIVGYLESKWLILSKVYCSYNLEMSPFSKIKISHYIDLRATHRKSVEDTCKNAYKLTDYKHFMDIYFPKFKK